MSRKILYIFLMYLSVIDLYSDHTIKFAMVEDHSIYYYKLLVTALEHAKVHIPIEKVVIPGSRAKVLLKSDTPLIHYMVENHDRNMLYTPIKVGLTNGLIGHRVLIIPKGEGHIYNDVKTLDDFRELDKTNAAGATWFGAKVWEANDLKVRKHTGDYTLIFKMVAQRNRGIDYFATGFNEAVLEIEKYGKLGLEIEKELLFIYDRDYLFYLSDSVAEYKDEIQRALQLAKDDGIIDKMVNDYWGENFRKLNFHGRHKIILHTPK